MENRGIKQQKGKYITSSDSFYRRITFWKRKELFYWDVAI